MSEIRLDLNGNPVAEHLVDCEWAQFEWGARGKASEMKTKIEITENVLLHDVCTL